MKAGSFKTVTLLFLMSAGLGGCAANSLGLPTPGDLVSPAIDLSPVKCPPVSRDTIAAINAKVPSPKPEPQMDGPTGVTRSKTADWIDRLRADNLRKRAAARELVKHVEECRTPLAAN
jgi:hypothetical protein